MKSKDKKLLVTGSAGFIGYHITMKFLKKGYFVTGIDNLSNYYDIKLKKDRIRNLLKYSKKNKKKFTFKKIDLIDKKKILKLFKNEKFDYVIHLAAQAGVRYSIVNPTSYLRNNLIGYFNILENCKIFKIKHLMYASTSSVYGGNIILPFKEEHTADHPIQFYAATKRSNELMAHSYSALYNLPTTALRFFTVYGPWGRPDMALYKFVKNIIKNKSIEVFNYGKHSRSFTYIDDVIESIFQLLKKIPKKRLPPKFKNLRPDESFAPSRIINIGNNKTSSLKNYINEIEINLKKKAKIKYLPLQAGDASKSLASTKSINKIINKKKFTKISVGIKKFIEWYKSYYKIS